MPLTTSRPAPGPKTISGTAARLPPASFFLTSAVFHYLGPSLAVLLFAHVEVVGVAWLRIASAAAFFAVWRRPWRILAVAGVSVLTAVRLSGACAAVGNVAALEPVVAAWQGTAEIYSDPQLLKAATTPLDGTVHGEVPEVTEP